MIIFRKIMKKVKNSKIDLVITKNIIILIKNIKKTKIIYNKITLKIINLLKIKIKLYLKFFKRINKNHHHNYNRILVINLHNLLNMVIINIYNNIYNNIYDNIYNNIYDYNNIYIKLLRLLKFLHKSFHFFKTLH